MDEAPLRTPLLTTAEAATYLKLKTPGAVLQHVRRGNLVPVSWGRRGRRATHMFSIESLEAFLRKA